jgi:hypothetical protein
MNEQEMIERRRRYHEQDALSDMDLDDQRLWHQLLFLAREYHDGHFTVMKFTGNWRVFLGTLDEYTVSDNTDRELPEIEKDLSNICEVGLRGAIRTMPKGATFAEAARAAIRQDEEVRERRRVEGRDPVSDEVGRIIRSARAAVRGLS